MFKKILITNRGEIAIRVMRACKELGIQTVAVYSDADKNSQHTQLADEAIHIGAPAAKNSYLNADVVIQAALASQADAIHPGYGFLSENASFALAVASANLTFIGPSADSIRAMGDKAESKIAMKRAGVPTVPGAEGLESESDFKKAAKEIGYPVLVKAAAGGGGKGMRVVNQADELHEAIESARREALNAFGDDRLLVEKYIPNAHHIEFQVFGDQHGHIVHLFERECSTQRRYQKIIEETPSPLLTPELRAKMGEAAVNAARAVNYYNAGTVEFIFDPALSSFFFLEMNTRLQVEHPVTELTTGLDLVQWQIRVAAGERFPYSQEQLTQRGHAIECRVYAEDPANGFLPSTGKLLQYIESRGPGIRVDSGFRADDEVTHFYDPLLAKLIAFGESRETAIQKMQSALRDFVVHGVTTNIDFLQDVLAHPDFSAGEVSTKWVESQPRWSQPNPSFESLIAASLADQAIVNRQSSIENRKSEIVNEPDPYSPWKNPNGFRN
ncbi:MAG: acetyl-CoA carboxylase biotin carboxylase subunit [Anaerolineales bacterium]|nr:acetyl-CoA carboxylase biotin carboxylase subunit [Anaerolineales bacterium]HMS00173.1 acetyl-CoA carboxylase biotin carboxylase subunit [Anaerolineales bacterium]HNQ95359.1 acetyl-CoA carboxylase biotin carboxylase subunit [Anaerolineales bacterium]